MSEGRTLAGYLRFYADCAERGEVKGCVLVLVSEQGSNTVSLGETRLSEVSLAFAEWFKTEVGRVAERLKAEGE